MQPHRKPNLDCFFTVESAGSSLVRLLLPAAVPSARTVVTKTAGRGVAVTSGAFELPASCWLAVAVFCCCSLALALLLLLLLLLLVRLLLKLLVFICV